MVRYLERVFLTVAGLGRDERLQRLGPSKKLAPTATTIRHGGRAIDPDRLVEET